jgi:protein-S-isoprenylcysteine O-methyltransferase Ste14
MITPMRVIPLLWAAWALSWVAAAAWSSQAAARPQMGSQLGYRFMMGLGAVMLFAGRGRAAFVSLWRAPPRPLDWALVALVAAGFGFCWWARLHLGRLWSSSVTRKADHHIVDTGPYALVRHPIYTGLIIAAAATAAVERRGIALLGLVVFIVGCWMKASLEERFLRAELGAAAYDAYARRVGMLFPGLGKLA